MRKKVFIMSADRSVLSQITEKLASEYDTASFKDIDELIRSLSKENPSLLMIDHDFSGAAGQKAFKMIKSASPDTKIIIISDAATIKDAVEITKLGASDCLAKPLQVERMTGAVKECLAEHHKEFRIIISDIEGSEWLLGTSPRMKSLFKSIEKGVTENRDMAFVCEAGMDTSVLARLIHNNGRKNSKRFDEIDLASFNRESDENYFWAMIQELLSEGNEPFSDSCGTLFFKNFDAVDKAFQESILRYLEDRAKKGPRDSAIMISFNRIDDMLEMDRKNLLENFSKIDIPPLRDRKEDIPLLLNTYLTKYSRKYGKDISAIATGLVEALASYDWPGNIMELESMLETSVIGASSNVLNIESFPMNYRLIFNKLFSKLGTSVPLQNADEELFNETVSQFAQKVKFKEEELSRLLDVPKNMISNISYRKHSSV